MKTAIRYLKAYLHLLLYFCTPYLPFTGLFGQVQDVSLLDPLNLLLSNGGESVDGSLVGWFKTVKHRFGLHRFGQGTLLGMYRWLILSLTAYLIAHWSYLHTQVASPPDWGQAAQTALESIFPKIVASLLLLEILRLTSLARSCGFDIHTSRCKI